LWSPLIVGLINDLRLVDVLAWFSEVVPNEFAKNQSCFSLECLIEFAIALEGL